MNLIKWLRKNNRKLMAVVVAILLIGLGIGSINLEQLFNIFSPGQGKTVAYYGEGQKITNNDRLKAQRELEILRMIDAPTLLKVYPAAGPYMRIPAFYTILLGELISENINVSTQASSYIKQLAMAQGYSVSEKQINDIYRRKLPAYYYWLLLREEAHQAGIWFSNEHAQYFLREIAENFFKTTYTQMMESLVNPSSGRTGVSEQEVLEAFSDLMAVWEYARIICSSEDVTEQQVRHKISQTRETMNLEFVRFDSLAFSEAMPEPNQQQITEQFEKFKDTLPDYVSDNNPYGFGYKLPDRVSFQYLAVKLEDVEKIINKPTNEDAVQFYRQYRDSLKQQVPKDPNDPNSPLMDRTLSFAEVADMIHEKLLADRVNSKTNEIIQKAKTLTELQTSQEDAAATQTAEKVAEKFEDAASRLSKEYNIKIYAGRTGLLSDADIQKDDTLRLLYLEGYGYNPITNPSTLGLSKVVFSVDPIDSSELGQFDSQKVKVFENIGPLKDMGGKTRMIIQIVDAEKAAVPNDINTSFSIDTISLGENKNDEENKSFSMKEKVIEDLKKLSAMETTGQKAREFAQIASESGWDKASEEFNRLYSKKSPDNNEPNNFELQELSPLPRMSSLDMQTFTIQAEGDPKLQTVIPEVEKRRLLAQNLYALIPPDSNSLANVPYVLEFKGEMSWYCIKKLTVKRVNQDEYEIFRVMEFFNEDITRMQSAAVVHYNPENILSRMQFKLAQKQQTPEDANDVTETSQGQGST